MQNISLTEESQVSPISDIQSIFDRLVSEYEDHVIPIHGIHDIKLLYDAGRVNDRTQSRSKLVWQSNPLSRRHLNLPSGSNTNPTGSMFFSKGTMDEIDQRHYFRDDVFSELSWKQDFIHPHYERAVANFRIVIRNVDCGTFMLQVSHNTRTDSVSYLQNNSMTQLHWGHARESYSQGRALNVGPSFCIRGRDTTRWK